MVDGSAFPTPRPQIMSHGCTPSMPPPSPKGQHTRSFRATWGREAPRAPPVAHGLSKLHRALLRSRWHVTALVEGEVEGAASSDH